MNWLDRAVSFVSPEAGLRRVHARNTLSLFGGGDSYHGADPRRRAMRNWFPRASSADSATIPALTTLRANSRDLVRNNPLAGGAISTVTEGVVGTGLSVQPQILHKRIGISEEEAQAWQREAKELFELWAERAEWCDWAGRLNFYGLQDLAWRSSLESGDSFALLPMAQDVQVPFDTRVQLIEADRICNPDNKLDGTGDWWGGIKATAEGRPLEVAIAEKHPGGFQLGNSWQIVRYFGEKTGRRNVLQVGTMTRPGQRRGVPYLAPVMEHLKQLGTYTEAEIAAAVLNSFFTVFVKKQAPDGPAPLDPPPSSTPTPGPSAGIKAGAEIGLASGSIVDLAEGEDVSFADPERPNAGFDPFVQAILRQIGVGLGLPFEVLIKHFTASYSAAQAALLHAWRTYMKHRYAFSWQFCQPVYEAVTTENIQRGRLRAPGFLRDPLVRAAYLRAAWIGDGRPMIDSEKEARGAKERVELGISDKAAETIAYSGRNWEDVHAQRVRERKAEERDGLGKPEKPVQTSGRPPVVDGPPSPDPDKTEEE